jgi:hypothetical protein
MTDTKTKTTTALDQGRTFLAKAIWVVCVIAALCLALGALHVVVKANADNGLVKAVKNLADFFDLGVFSKDGGIKKFTGDDADVKNALVNWGIGACVWLIVGRVLDRIIRPGS